MYTSRARTSLLFCILALTLLLAACGQNTASSEQAINTGGYIASPSASPEPTAGNENTAAGQGEMVFFHADNGDIQVPKHPQRIVDLTAFDTGYLLALGIKPVGAPAGAIDNPYLKGMLDGAENLGEDISPEKIISLNPDLIIVFSGTPDIDKLEAIAPVVVIAYGKKNFKDQMLDFGKLVNKEAEAKAWVDQWNKKIADLKPQIQEAVGDKTVSILNPYAKGLYVFGHNYGRGGEIIYGEFGLKAPPEAQKEAIDSGTGWASISLEKLPQYAGDIIFTCAWSGDTTDPKVVYDSNVWKGLPAVRAGHVFQLNPRADTYNDPVTLDAQLDYISQSLLSMK